MRGFQRDVIGPTLLDPIAFFQEVVKVDRDHRETDEEAEEPEDFSRAVEKPPEEGLAKIREPLSSFGQGEVFAGNRFLGVIHPFKSEAAVPVGGKEFIDVGGGFVVFVFEQAGATVEAPLLIVWSDERSPVFEPLLHRFGVFFEYGSYDPAVEVIFFLGGNGLYL